MKNVIDISRRLPPPKFQPRIADSSAVESFETAPTEYQISALRGIVLQAAKQMARLVGTERMFYELSDVSVAAAQSVSSE